MGQPTTNHRFWGGGKTVHRLGRGPHKVGDANEFTPRCALNFEEHSVRYAGLDRSAVGSRKYFTVPALEGDWAAFLGTPPLH
jgi:hypothetical protein